MKNTMTKEAIALIQRRAHRYNWYAERVASGKATKADKEVMEEEYNELIAIIDTLKALGFDVTDVNHTIENSYEVIFTLIEVNGKKIFTA